MKRHVILFAKFAFGVLPSIGGALLALLGITKMIEAQLVPSRVFRRSPLTFEHLLILVVLLCVVVGGIACGVAWLKEWRRNEERNRWLIGGLVLALVGVAAIAGWATYVGAGAWPWLGIPVFLVSLASLRRESGLAR